MHKIQAIGAQDYQIGNLFAPKFNKTRAVNQQYAYNQSNQPNYTQFDRELRPKTNAKFDIIA